MHWSAQPIALQANASAGGVVLINDTAYGALYISDGALSTAVCIDDDLEAWTQLGDSITVADLPAGYVGLGDAAVWHSYNGSQSIGIQALVTSCVDSGNHECGGEIAFLLYTALGFADWEYVGPIFQLPLDDSLPASPDWFAANNGQNINAVLMFSSPALGSTQWYTGSSSSAGFTPVATGTADLGVLDSTSSFTDAIGRRIMYGWIREERPVSESTEAGWAGVLSFPREIIVNADDSLSFPPAQEVSLLRTGFTSCNSNPVQYGMDYPGGDYTNVDLSGYADPTSACQELCCSNSTCVVWVIALPQPAADWNCPEGVPCCWLKNSLPAANPNSICNVRKSLLFSVHLSCDVVYRVDLQPRILASFSTLASP